VALDDCRLLQQRVEDAWHHLKITQARAEGRGHGLAAHTDQTKPHAPKNSKIQNEAEPRSSARFDWAYIRMMMSPASCFAWRGFSRAMRGLAVQLLDPCAGLFPLLSLLFFEIVDQIHPPALSYPTMIGPSG
jgi:hypothetical protein